VIFRRAKDSSANKAHGIVDTGYPVALARHEDEHYEWTTGPSGEFQFPLLAGEAVLAATAFIIESTAYAPGLLQRDVLRIAFDCSSHVDQLLALAVRYADRNKREVIPRICPPKK
jgi:hypothetical protein